MRRVTLEELCTLARAVARQLVRPVTVFDVIEAADEADERERRANLVRLVRSPDVDIRPRTHAPPSARAPNE
jgi:hypothetical protein